MEVIEQTPECCPRPETLRNARDTSVEVIDTAVEVIDTAVEVIVQTLNIIEKATED